MAKKKGKSVKVDFTGVEAGPRGRLLPEGEQFKFEVKEVEQEVGEDSGEPYLKFTLEVLEGDFEGTKAWDNFSLQPQALWKLRGFMEAGGMTVEEGEMDIDLDEFVGVIVLGNIVHEEYKGKPKHRIDSYESVDGSTEAAATDKSSAKKKPADDADDWKVGAKVTFKDGKKKIAGKIKSDDGDGKFTVVVKGVSKDADGEYELESGDLEAA